jgi:hypothetical protein
MSGTEGIPGLQAGEQVKLMPTKTKTEPAVPDQAAAGVPPMTLEWLDPGIPLADRDERTDLRLNSGLLDSIREHGVLVPLSAERTQDGQVRIRTVTGARSPRSRPAGPWSRCSCPQPGMTAPRRTSTGSCPSTPRTTTGKDSPRRRKPAWPPGSSTWA